MKASHIHTAICHMPPSEFLVPKAVRLRPTVSESEMMSPWKVWWPTSYRQEIKTNTEHMKHNKQESLLYSGQRSFISEPCYRHLLISQGV